MDEIPDILLNLPRPLARGASVCHVLAIRDNTGTMVAACGTSCGGFCGEASYEAESKQCSEHDENVCPDCIEVINEFERSGEWEGVESDPFFGIPRSVCYAGRCPNLVVITKRCWCFEHLTVCREDDCEHPAHECEDEIHFCPDHGGPGVVIPEE